MGVRSQEPGPILLPTRVRGGPGSYHRRQGGIKLGSKGAVQLKVDLVLGSDQLDDLGRESLSLGLFPCLRTEDNKNIYFISYCEN